jgi:hypothetical protein
MSNGRARMMGPNRRASRLRFCLEVSSSIALKFGQAEWLNPPRKLFFEVPASLRS